MSYSYTNSKGKTYWLCLTQEQGYHFLGTDKYPSREICCNQLPDGYYISEESDGTPILRKKQL